MTYKDNREGEHLQNFKKMIRDLLILLRTSLQAETVSLHWVNSNRDVLVLEGFETNQKNVVYQDRVSRKEHFLGRFDAIKSVTRLETGTHLATSELTHYTSDPPVNYLYLIPFTYNTETVAITTVETSEKSQLTGTEEAAIAAYEDVLFRLLKTHLELSDLSEKQTEWSDYEETVKKLIRSRSAYSLVTCLLEELQEYAGSNGGAVLMARGMDDWHTVLYSEKAAYPPPLGLRVQENSISGQALGSGEPLFSSHLNANPKRISVHEPLCNGASLAVPVMHRQRRQLVALSYSENPLVFNEATKHKIGNLCRVAGLKMESMFPGLDVQEDIFAAGNSGYRKDLFSGALSTLQRHHKNRNGVLQSWVGMVGIGNIADLRSKHRLDDLLDLQHQVLRRLRPQEYGFSGILGEYSDYVYCFLLQSADEAAFGQWTDGVEEAFRSPVPFSAGISERVTLHLGYLLMDNGTDADRIIGEVRKAMNQAMKQELFKMEV
ncbi:GAF domain-containing protein [Balneolales bacterium ANBcel1]|nr:GAF domain-containing protein [Balneolales bacterium ANBcel1]